MTVVNRDYNMVNIFFSGQLSPTLPDRPIYIISRGPANTVIFTDADYEVRIQTTPRH